MGVEELLIVVLVTVVMVDLRVGRVRQVQV